ncbi:MAG: hypothetical protein U9N13_09280 [Euryarchaeota archaeon]|nr:hypothetical protein [Euryarchaeota archaeon]
MIDTIQDKKPKMEEYFKKGIFILAMMFLVVSSFQLYFSIDRILQTWFEYQYVPIFKSFYNLAVVGISLYIMRLYFVKR